MKIGNSFSSIALIGLFAAALAPQMRAQTVSVSPSSLSFTSAANSSSIQTQNLTVSLTGTGALSVGTTGSWLKVVAPGCTAPGFNCQSNTPGSAPAISVQADATSLSANTYSGFVNITYAGQTPTLIPVTFTVGGGSNSSATLTASPASLSFSALPGAVAQSQNVAVSNTGNAVNYTVTSSAAWLTTNLGGGQGTSPGSLTVSASAVGLAANNYGGTLTLTPVGGGTPTTVNVSFAVSSTQQFQVNPSALTLSYIAGSGAPSPSTSLSVGVTTGSNVAYNVAITYTGTTGWLSTTPTSSGTTGTTLVATATGASALAAGTYQANIALTGTNLTTVNIPVTLTVGAAPTFVVNPNPVTVSVQPSGVSSRILSISTSNGAAVNYTVTPQSVAWLSVSNATGTTPNSATVTVNAGALAVGNYFATLGISSTTPGVQPITVNITMTVTTSQIVTYSPTSLSYNYVGGSAAPASQTIALGLTPATPVQQVSLTVPNGEAWLSATLASSTPGSITTGTSAVVTVNPGGLANGTYTATLRIFVFGNVNNSTIDIPVTMTITGVTGGNPGTGTPTVLLSQSQLIFATTPSGTPPDQTITLNSNVTSALPYTLSTSTTWLQIFNQSGNTPGSAIIRVNTSGLLAGTYQGQIILTSTGASNNGVGIPVTLTISATNQLQVNPSGLNFFYTVASGFPLAQSLQVSATTSTQLPVTATVSTTSGGAWLNLNTTSVSTTGQFLVSVNSTVLQTLVAGTYTGNILLTTTGALQNSINIPVTLVVNGTTNPNTGLQQIILSPTPLNFFSTVGGGTNPQVLDINTLSGTVLPYSLTFTSNGGTWLSVSPISGSTPGQAIVTAASSTLAAGTYSGSIAVTSSGAINSGASVPVTLTVSPATNLVANPAGLTFTYAIGGSTSLLTKFITVGTTTGSVVPITVTASSSTNQLTVSTSSNSSPAGITVTFNPTGLAAGLYSGTISVNASGANNSPMTLPVTMIITGAGNGSANQLSLSPTNLTFYAQPNGAPPQQRTVQVSSSLSNIAYSVSSNQTWLLAGPISGSTPGTVTVGVNPNGLSAGTYTGVVTVTGGLAPVSLPVTFEVTNSPLLQISQQSLTFNYQTGLTLPAPRPILLTTSNGTAVAASMTASTSSGGNWLVVSPTALSTPGAFAVSLANNIVSTLGAGTYTGTIAISAPGTANVNTSITVTLNVSATALLTLSTTPITFNAQFNGNAPPAQTRMITATSGALSVTVSTSTSTGSGWLSAAINSNTTPSTLTITASPFGLGTGVYNGTVTVTSGVAASALVIPITLNVSSLPLISIDKSELLFGSGGTSGAAPQTIQITSSSSNFNFIASASVTNSPTNWLTIGTTSGVTPTSLTVSVNPALLNDGTYFGTIVLSAPGAGNTPLVIPVTLTVNNATALTVSPTALTFTQIQGAALPAQQSLQVTSQQPVTFSYTSTVQTPVSGNWLSVTQSGGLTNGFLQVGLNNTAAALPVGTYTATITVFGQNSPNNVPVTVTLNVVSSNSLVAAPVSLTFAGRVGQPNPPVQTVQITSSNTSVPVPFSVSSDAAWLTATPASGTSPTALTVAVNQSALAAGITTATGHLTLTPSGVVSGPSVSITVTFTVDQAPAPVITGFANAATFQAGSLSPGMIFTIVGTNLGPSPAVNGSVVGGRFTTTLSGVRVLFDGIAAPILYASSTQINAVVPYSLAGRASARMSVEYSGVASATIEPRLVDTAPGIFTTDGRQVAMINENGSYNSAAAPALAGSTVAFYITGEGQTNPAGVDGEVIGSTLKKPLAAVRIRVNGVEVPATDILYAGSAPTLVSGLMQINFKIPAATPAGGATSLEVIVGSGQSQPGVTLAVRR